MVKYTGMRNGISLVEMMIAIILFGVVSIIGYKYYTNFMNTSLSGQKARVAAVIDQARQLSNAYDVYKAQFGDSPTTINDLNASNAMILTEIPPGIEGIAGTTNVVWELATNLNIDGTVGDIAFTYPINTSTTADDLQYCNIFNNLADSDWELNAAAVPDALATAYSGGFTTFFCWDNIGDGSGTTQVVFIKELN